MGTVAVRSDISVSVGGARSFGLLFASFASCATPLGLRMEFSKSSPPRTIAVPATTATLVIFHDSKAAPKGRFIGYRRGVTDLASQKDFSLKRVVVARDCS